MTEIVEEIETEASQAQPDQPKPAPERRRLSLAERARKITALAALLGAIAFGVSGAEGKHGQAKFNRGTAIAQYQEAAQQKLGHGMIRVQVDPSEVEQGSVTVNAESDRLPLSLEKTVMEQVDAVNQLIEPSKRASHIVLKNLSNSEYPFSNVNGHGGSLLDHNIKLEVRAGKPFSPEEINSVAFHEMIHYFQASQLHDMSGYGDEVYGAFYDDFMKLTLDRYTAQKLLDMILTNQGASFDQRTAIEDIPNNDEVEGALFSLADESSYEKQYAGHPYDITSEFMASLASVMRFYPNSLMENIKQLDAKNQATMTKACRDLVELMKKGAYDPAAVASLFSPELLTYIGAN